MSAPSPGAVPASVFPERTGCPFCGDADGEVLAELDYHDTAEAHRELPNVRGRLRACAACGVAYPSHGYDLARLVDLYQKNLAKLDLFHRSALQELRQALLRAVVRGRPRPLSPGSLLDALSLRALLVPPWTAPVAGRAVLDVGGGYGDFSRIFRELGASVVCTEVVPALVERLRSDGFECHLEELEKLDVGERRFDLIFLRGVLYRSREPAAALQALRRLLAPGGEVACLDPGAGRETASAYFFRRQFPQGQFYPIDRERYAAMLRRRFGLELVAARQIYGRPAPLPRQGVLGNLEEFASILSGNLLRLRPYVLAYTLREAAADPDPGGRGAAPAAAPPSLACIMPALNEEANVEPSVRRVVAALEKHTDAFEVIVVDDGSSDRTGEIAARLAAEDPRVRVLRNPTPASYGVALLQGIRAARSEWVFHDGMDLPLAPEDLGLFVPQLADADVVVASRISRAAHSRWRRITSWTNNLLLRLLFAPRTRDLNFTQFYRRDFVLATRLVNLGPASVTPELILRAERTGLRVREVPVEFRRREAGRAHFGRLGDILWTLVDLARLRIRTWLGGWR